jgi:arylsulfatase A-like enzyme
MVRLPGGENGGVRVKEQVQGIDIVPTVLDYLGIPPDHGFQGSSLLPLVRGEAGATGSEYAFIDRIPWWEHTLSRWYLEFKSSQVNFPLTEKTALIEYGDMLRKEFPHNSYPPNDIAIRTNRWKLVLRKSARLLEKVSWYSFITHSPLKFADIELFDLVADPLEKRNVASDNPAIAESLKKRLLEWDASIEQKKASYGVGEKRFIIPYP